MPFQPYPTYQPYQPYQPNWAGALNAAATYGQQQAMPQQQAPQMPYQQRGSPRPTRSRAACTSARRSGRRSSTACCCMRWRTRSPSPTGYWPR